MIRDNFKFSWVLPLIASPVGVLLWIIDVRTRTLYHAAIDAGKHLEGETGGFFTELDKVAFKKGTCIFSHLTQSLAVSILFLGSSALFIILSVILFITNL